MKLQLTLCEHASIHPDSTVTMVRSGIDRGFVAKPEDTCRFRCYLCVRIVATPAERGTHKVVVGLIDADGKARAPTVEAQITVPEGGGASALCLGMNFQQGVGLYEFTATIDGLQYDSWPVRIFVQAQNPA